MKLKHIHGSLLLAIVAAACAHEKTPQTRATSYAPPQNYPSQSYPNYPPQNYPPQNYPPQNYPPQNYPPQNYPPQNYPPQNYPPQTQPPPTTAWPFPLPPGWTLPPAPTGWAIPGIALPFPTATASAPPAPTQPPSAAVPNALAIELADRINAYRVSRGLPAIPRSRKVGITAQTHVMDLEQNRPNNETCNMHSWSSQGPWTPCCYTPDHAQSACMWKKPAEIAGFSGNGYEIASYTSGNMTAAGALEMWKGSPNHHAVIINEGSWAGHPWRSLGTGVSNHFAVAWFAEEADPAGGY